MATFAPPEPLQIGQLVRRRTDPEGAPIVGLVGRLIFGDPGLAVVRWRGALSTFEREDALEEVVVIRLQE
jgi:hypothetical protein